MCCVGDSASARGYSGDVITKVAHVLRRQALVTCRYLPLRAVTCRTSPTLESCVESGPRILLVETGRATSSLGTPEAENQRSHTLSTRGIPRSSLQTVCRGGRRRPHVSK